MMEYVKNHFLKFIFFGFVVVIGFLGFKYFSLESYNMSSKSIEIYEDLKMEVKKVSFEMYKKRKFILAPQDFRKCGNEFLIKHEGKREELQSVRDYYINSEKILVRHYIPREGGSKNVILFVHGGAWIQGNLETHDYLCRKISKIFDTELLAINYSLAPEKVFPKALNEIFLVYKWCAKRYDRVILSGDSAGGNLVLSLCLKLNDIKFLKRPCFQILMYPVLSNDFESDSFNRFHSIARVSKAFAIEALKQYVGKTVLSPSILNNKYIFPGLADAYVFPKTVLISSECDVLLDSAKKFTKKLKERAWQITVPGAVHGFMTFGKEFNYEIEKILTEISKSQFFENM